MPLMTAGHWITTDSGQHILILPGHGTTREQVAAHFKSKGQPNHPDVGKAVVHHRGGFDPEKANRGISTRNGAEAMQVRIKGHEEAGKGKPSKPEGKAPAKEPASSKSPDTARADRLKRLNSKLPAEQTKTLRERAAELKGTKRAVEQGRAERVGSKPKEEAKPAPAETTTNRLAGAPTKSMTLRERAAMKARPKSVEAETPAAKPSMILREKIASRKADAAKPGSESFREGRVSDRAWERGQKLRAAGKGEEAEAEFSRHDRMMRRLYHKTPEGAATSPKPIAPTLREQAATARANPAIKRAQAEYQARQGQRNTLREQAAAARANRLRSDSAGIKHPLTPEDRTQRAGYLRDLRREGMERGTTTQRLNSAQPLNERLGNAMAETPATSKFGAAYGTRGNAAARRYRNFVESQPPKQATIEKLPSGAYAAKDEQGRDIMGSFDLKRVHEHLKTRNFVVTGEHAPPATPALAPTPTLRERAASSPLGGFKRQDVAMQSTKGFDGSSKTVPADVKGVYTVHKPEGESRHVITHAPTGLRLPGEFTATQAKKIVSTLHEQGVDLGEFVGASPARKQELLNTFNAAVKKHGAKV